MKSLINELNYLTELYDKGIQKVTDEDWDEMYFALKRKKKKLVLFILILLFKKFIMKIFLN